MTIMTVHGGSGVNADYEEIVITKDGQKVLDQRYYYGYDVSWLLSRADEEKPYIDYLLNDLKNKFCVNEVRRI